MFSEEDPASPKPVVGRCKNSELSLSWRPSGLLVDLNVHLREVSTFYLVIKLMLLLLLLLLLLLYREFSYRPTSEIWSEPTNHCCLLERCGIYREFNDRGAWNQALSDF